MNKPNHIESHIGEDTPVTVWFDYSPGQSGQYLGPPSIHEPKVDAHIVIIEVALNGDDILPDLSPLCVERLEQQCWDKVRS